MNNNFKIITISLIMLFIGFISGITYTVTTMQVDIVENTETGSIVRIIVLDQWFNHYVEK